MTEFAKARPIATLMSIGVFLLMGIISLFRMSVTLSTGVTYPGLTIQVDYAGVTPDKIEEIITRPLEDATSAVGGIREIFSSSEEGKVRVNVLFESNVDVETSALEMRERIDIVAARFPREAQKPVILQYDPDQKPVMIFGLESARDDPAEIRELLERGLRKTLQGIPGVSEVFVAGGRDREILVDCDRQKLQAYKLSMADVLSVIRTANMNLSLGKVNHAGGEFRIHARGRFLTIGDISSLPLQVGDTGRSIHLGDIADVRMTLRDQDSASRVNGSERVSLYIYRASGADLISISRAAHNELERFAPSARLSYSVLHDQAEQVISLILKFLAVFFCSLLLCAIALWYQSDSLWRAIFAVLLIPAQMVITLFPLYLLGQEITMITLGASIMAVIPTVFFIPDWIQDSPQVNRPDMILSLLVMLTSFLPIIFGARSTRQLFMPAFATISIQLVVGYLLLRTLLPVLFILNVRRIRFPRFLPLISGAIVFRSWLLLHLDRISLNRTVQQGIQRFRSIPQPLIPVAILLAGVVAFFLLPASLGKPAEGGDILVHIEFPSGSSFAITDTTTRKIEKALADVRSIRQLTSKVESSQGTIFLKLAAGVESDEELLDSLRQKIGKPDPAFVYVSSGDDASTGREVTVDVYGEDLKTLDSITRELAKKVEKFPDASNVVMRYKAPRPELRVTVSKDKAERVGITSREVGEILRSAIQGGIPTKFVEKNREVDVRVRYKEDFRKSAEDIGEIYLRNAEGIFVPLREISKVKEEQVPVKIFRKNKKRTYSFSFRPRDLNYSHIVEMANRLSTVQLPDGYRMEFSRDFKETVEARRSLYKVGLLAVILIFMVVAAGRESYRAPFPFLADVVIACAGGAIALFILNQTLNMMALIGLGVVAGLSLSLREGRQVLLPGTFLLSTLFFPGEGRAWFAPGATAFVGALVGLAWLRPALVQSIRAIPTDFVSGIKARLQPILIQVGPVLRRARSLSSNLWGSFCERIRHNLRKS